MDSEHPGLNPNWTGHPSRLLTDAFGLFVHLKQAKPGSPGHSEDHGLLLKFIAAMLNTPGISGERSLVLRLMQSDLQTGTIPQHLWEEYKGFYLEHQAHPLRPVPEVFFGIYLALEGSCIDAFQAGGFHSPDLEGWFQDTEGEGDGV